MKALTGKAAAFAAVLVVIVGLAEGSRLDDLMGSPCYETDDQGNEDLTKPQVRKL